VTPSAINGSIPAEAASVKKRPVGLFPENLFFINRYAVVVKKLRYKPVHLAHNGRYAPPTMRLLLSSAWQTAAPTYVKKSVTPLQIASAAK